MKIEWMLRDSRFCDGCPLMHMRDRYYERHCGLGWRLPNSRREEGIAHDVTDRPEVCLRRNGQ